MEKWPIWKVDIENDGHCDGIGLLKRTYYYVTQYYSVINNHMHCIRDFFQVSVTDLMK